MSDEAAMQVLRRAAERGDPRHSAAYHWLKRNYRRLERLGYGSGPGLGLAALRDALAAAGQVNRDGAPLTTEVVRKLLKRVRRDVQAERAARASQPASAERPSRRARSAAPPPVIPAPPRPASRPLPAVIPASVAHAATAKAPTAPAPDAHRTPEQQIADARAILRRFDRWMRP